MSVAVVLCGEGLQSLDEFAATDTVHVVSKLCSYPARLVEFVTASDRLVLGVCSGDYSLGAIQKEVRKAGLDPLGVELVDLSAIDGHVARLELMLGAATARADAFAGSRPEHAKLSMPESVSRRDLFSHSYPQYVAAPAIVERVCAAEDGCRACVDVCPRAALTWKEGRVTYDKVACEPCGLCITRCPTGAIVNPSFTPLQVESEIEGLLDPTLDAPGGRGIVFVCSRGSGVEAAPGWYPVTVPCTAMVTTTWLLAPLAMGAGSVAAVPCNDSGCPLAYDGILEARVASVQGILARLGLAPDRVASTPEARPCEPLRSMRHLDAFGPLGGSEVIKALAALAGKFDASFPQVGSPVGVIEIDSDACTGCTMCAQTCPTGALGYEYGEDEVRVTFDAALCTSCGQCLPRCPEQRWGAISLIERVDLPALARGRGQLYATGTARCDQCGELIASAAMMDRIGSLLGEDHPSVDFLGSYCIECRRTARAGF